MRVLVTNDDGFDADGLRAIRSALAAIFDNVVTIAPEDNCSGFARKCTFARPVSVTRVEGGPHPIYRCDGTPADCVRAGLLGGLAAAADLVVSGINHGANLADDVTYSGTVGAGLEAAILGTPALVLSQQTPTGSLGVTYQEDLTGTGFAYDFAAAARHGADLASCVVRAVPGEPVVLSVNYPAARPFGPSVLTRAGRREYPRAEVPEFGADGDVRKLWLFGEPDEDIPYADASVGTDIGALRSGHVSITPLSFALEVSDLSPGFQAFLSRLTESFPLGGQAAIRHSDSDRQTFTGQ